VIKPKFNLLTLESDVFSILGDIEVLKLDVFITLLVDNHEGFQVKASQQRWLALVLQCSLLNGTI
jgi:hypothetical protein